MAYHSEISNFTNWCENNKLNLNVSKTKELTINFSSLDPMLDSLIIKDESVEIVNSYKYLGITLKDNLNWSDHVDTVVNKANKRLYLLRKLRSFNIDTTLLTLFYRATVETIFSFCISAWGGNSCAKDLSKIDHMIKRARKTCRNSILESVEDILDRVSLSRFQAILDPGIEHPLRDRFTFSTRMNRVILPITRTERYRCSFVPRVSRLIANAFKR